MISLVQLLQQRGLDFSKKIKVVRHQDKRCDINEYYRLGHMETYQRYQSKKVFNCDYIVTFMGLQGSLSLLIGVYRVGECLLSKGQALPSDYPDQDVKERDEFYYELDEVSGFEDYKGRVVIEWGNAAISWHQWLDAERDKEVLEILPPGYVRNFPGYLDFILDHSELAAICANPQANRVWHRMLSAVAGVYLIVDAESGLQYVGSAYGENGILGRWMNYAKKGHGGNKKLKEALKTGEMHIKNLRFTVLRTLPKSLTAPEVIAYEVLYKNKLGSRAFGLNTN
ncbi:MAG: GIY-YIG nuclease family protein [Desulfatibacillum sp.]|nr:GIY-YIG nuclease family protein [Desulfatibacillum sp.]